MNNIEEQYQEIKEKYQNKFRLKEDSSKSEFKYVIQFKSKENNWLYMAFVPNNEAIDQEEYAKRYFIDYMRRIEKINKI